MDTGLSPSEKVHDPQFEQLVGSLCTHPGMYVSPATFGSVCAYLDGFDAARSSGPSSATNSAASSADKADNTGRNAVPLTHSSTASSPGWFPANVRSTAGP